MTAIDSSSFGGRGMIPEDPALFLLVKSAVAGCHTDWTPHSVGPSLLLNSIVELRRLLLAVRECAPRITPRPANGPLNCLKKSQIIGCFEKGAHTCLSIPSSLASFVCVVRLSFLYSFFFAVGVENLDFGPTTPFLFD